MPNNTYRLRFMAFIAVFVICASFLSGSAAAVDAVQARKDIKALGLEYYSGQEFAKAAGNDDMAAVRDMGLKGKQSQLKLPPKASRLSKTRLWKCFSRNLSHTCSTELSSGA